MSTTNAARAWFALQQALKHIDKASAKEADMIRTLAHRYVEDYDPANRRIQDEAYRQAVAGKRESNPAADKAFERAWDRSDIWLRSSKF